MPVGLGRLGAFLQKAADEGGTWIGCPAVARLRQTVRINSISIASLLFVSSVL